jgi:hypothetical protein
MSVYSELEKANNRERERAKNMGDLIFYSMIIDYRKVCAVCGELLLPDYDYKGIGEQLKCGCRNWQINYHKYEYEPVKEGDK